MLKRRLVGRRTPSKPLALRPRQPVARHRAGAGRGRRAWRRNTTAGAVAVDDGAQARRPARLLTTGAMIELVIAKPFAGAGMVATTLEVTPQKAQLLTRSGWFVQNLGQNMRQRSERSTAITSISLLPPNPAVTAAARASHRVSSPAKLTFFPATFFAKALRFTLPVFESISFFNGFAAFASR
ncbi:hypothetical protein GHK48_05400 [Sinorhizobium fredii]|uniref:Uncharacterized protein n=1 Tax=Rhizobium fredii TaxID=380 RepID=A0A844A7D1_RHIFR|nr:hypothetical protein [Sinorhizobium fredii]MQX07765.1 hypothetical protein [Sinorhizobium fredii]UTY47833.1 hypothetical protein EPK84_14320 [Sinorhizobium fredii]